MLGWVGRIVAWLVILGISAIIAIAVLIPRITDATPYVVLTGSMRPSMPPGTLVVAKHVKTGELGIGDVVTYQLKSGQPEVVTHRIVAMGSLRGEPIFRTQGDANTIPDEKWVRPVQIMGKKWYSVPYLGYVTSLITNQQRQAVLVVIVGCLFGYSAVMFTSAARDRAKKSRLHTTKGETP